MAVKLDDFLSKKKEPAQVLDLSKVKITSKEEFRKYFDKIPEYKIKPEKVMPETVKIRDKDFSFAPGRREQTKLHEWNYPDPTPPDMKSVKLEDLCPVNIDWKMLTTLRPKTKVEEDMFSRLVQLGKLDLKYQQMLKREKDTDWVRKTKNPRSSIVETKVLSCKECGEDFCDGSLCNMLMYENFFRIQPSTSTGIVKDGSSIDVGDEPVKKKKKKRRSRKRTRSKVRRRKPRKNSIFNRPVSRGCSRDHSRRGSHANIAEKIRTQSAIRAASLSRSRSRERRPSVAPADEVRARSAPRIQFKGPTPDIKPPYLSDSGPTQTDYSSQSESESPSYQYRTAGRLQLPGRGVRSRSRSVVFSDTYQSDGETTGRKKFRRECTLLDYKEYSSDASGAESQDSETDSCSPTRSSSQSPEKLSQPFHPYQQSQTGTKPKQPSTIDIAFDELCLSAHAFCPSKSYTHSKIATTSSSRKSDFSSAALRNQEVTKIMEGFSKIELGFKEPTASTSSVAHTRKGPKIRPKTTQPAPVKAPTTACLKGKAILAKPSTQKLQ